MTNLMASQNFSSLLVECLSHSVNHTENTSKNQLIIMVIVVVIKETLIPPKVNRRGLLNSSAYLSSFETKKSLKGSAITRNSNATMMKTIRIKKDMAIFQLRWPGSTPKFSQMISEGWEARRILSCLPFNLN